MDFVVKDEIRELMRERDRYCVSIFLPTHRAGREIEQDPIRLDNLLRKAEKELVGRGMRSPHAREMLSPAYELMSNGFFVRHLADGLSIFASEGQFKYFRVPIHFEERLAVGRRFYLKPLLPMLNTGRRFLVLAASRKAVRLLECTEFGVNEIELKGVPQGMREALGYDDTESRLLFRTVPQGPNSRSVAAFHGHGGGTEADKEYLSNYFQCLKDTLHPYLKDEKAPLVFAGVEYLFPFIKEVNLYPNVMEDNVEGNPDGLDPQELQTRALEIVGSWFQKEEEKAVQRCLDLTNGPLSSCRLEEILPAAFEGKVDTIFLDTGVQRWGRYDRDSGLVMFKSRQENGDVDLLDLATAQTYLHRGNVFTLDAGRMPCPTESAAIFRY